MRRRRADVDILRDVDDAAPECYSTVSWEVSFLMACEGKLEITGDNTVMQAAFKEWSSNNVANKTNFSG